MSQGSRNVELRISRVHKIKLPIALPKGIVASDLKYPSYKSKDGLVPWSARGNSFELWVVGLSGEALEWFIPTLHIANASRRAGPGATTERTYATRVKDGKGGYRIGRGPHVKGTLTVYVRKSRVAALAPFLDMRTKGQEVAGQIRDRISSRRAQGALMRAEGRSHWRWDAP